MVNDTDYKFNRDPNYVGPPVPIPPEMVDVDKAGILWLFITMTIVWFVFGLCGRDRDMKDSTAIKTLEYKRVNIIENSY